MKLIYFSCLLIPLFGLAADFKTVYQEQVKNVVLVENIQWIEHKPQHWSHGSGVVVSQNGLIATAFHVVDHPGEFLARRVDGRPYRVFILSSDKTHDVAILAPVVPQEGVSYSELSLAPQIGSQVASIGCPLHLRWVIGVGTLSGAQKGILITTAQIAPGSSGGPVFDEVGAVVGLSTAIFTVEAFSDVPSGFGMIQPAEYVNDLLRRYDDYVR